MGISALFNEEVQVQRNGEVRFNVRGQFSTKSPYHYTFDPRTDVRVGDYLVGKSCKGIVTETQEERIGKEYVLKAFLKCEGQPPAAADKCAALLALAKQRQNADLELYQGNRDGRPKNIGAYHDGVYECDHVSPYTKSAGNCDADIMVMLQDWNSDECLSGPVKQCRVELGYNPDNDTNVNLIRLLRETFGITLADTYATNLFPFAKGGRMNADIPRDDMLRAAREFALPQIRIVKPKLVICLGLSTFNALRQASGWSRCSPLELAISKPFNIDTASVWCQAHTGRLGQNNRNKGGVNRVSQDWQRMKQAFLEGVCK
jgi:restriction system protein